MRKIKFAAILIILFLLPIVAFAQNANDYLIASDIGSYRKITGGGPASSVLAGTDHFYLDHNDTSWGIAYVNDSQKIWIDVKVNPHTGGDSDRWLLHEIEDSYRDGDEHAKLGLLIQATRLREINGNKIIGRRGNGYTWISNNVVIDVSYTDLKGNKPEPLEIVQAYLAKFPSSITITDAVFKSSDYNIKWIKDEMDRRLWLCDKWNAQSQAGGVTQADLMVKLLENMDVFLKYRQKYFNVAAEAESNLLGTYHENNDLVSIQKKLTEYKTWWAKHKDKRISL